MVKVKKVAIKCEKVSSSAKAFPQWRKRNGNGEFEANVRIEEYNGVPVPYQLNPPSKHLCGLAAAANAMNKFIGDDMTLATVIAEAQAGFENDLQRLAQGHEKQCAASEKGDLHVCTLNRILNRHNFKYAAFLL